jgi:protein SCO1/2
MPSPTQSWLGNEVRLGRLLPCRRETRCQASRPIQPVPREGALHMSFRRYAAVFVLVIALGTPTAFALAADLKLEDYEAGPYSLGGEFTLTAHTGHKVNLKDYRGRAVLVFFGYTYCPDVCPLTLTELGRVRKLLGAQAGQAQGVFVTVDPARDTPQRLKAYLANFDKTIVGLTGTDKEIREVADRYQARFARGRTRSASDYLMDHTGFVYLLDGQGKVRYLFSPDAGATVMADGVRRVLKG